MGTKEVDPCPGYEKCDRFKPGYKTNADHIRSMTDEELADFLCDATYKENEQGYPIMRTVNKAWWRKWLRQPYKEAADD
jgi:hypothetical protein